MKQNLLTIVLFLLIIFPVKSFSQTGKITCDYSNYADRHNSDQVRNQILDSACVAINGSRYGAAYQLLKTVANIDSLATGEPDAFVSQQIDKLKRYIDEHGEAPAAEAKPEPAKTETVIVQEKTEAQPEKVKTSDADSGAKKSKKKGKKQDDITVGIAKETIENKGGTAKEPEPVKTEQAIEKTETVVEKTEPAKEAEPQIAADESAKEVSKTSESAPPDTQEQPQAKTADPFDAANQSEPEKTFTEAELAQFQNKGLQKVKLLEGYLQQIGSKTTSATIALDATDNAKLLFDSEERTVQVSNLKGGNKFRFRIAKYLERLRMLNYDDISIEWADFQYTSDFIKGTDGNYHGYIIFRQRFTGYKDSQLAYEDITTKKTEVILKFYSKAVGGIESDNYDVLLGDISVEQTEKN